MKIFIHKFLLHLKVMKLARFRLLFMWFFACLTISLIAYIDTFVQASYNYTILLAPFGATTVIIFTIPHSPIGQSKNVIFGHTISAIIGISCFFLFGEATPVSIGISVATALVAMIVTNTLHPPGGATALIAALGGSVVQELGYLYPFFPVALGAIITVILGEIFNYITNLITNKEGK